MGVNGGVRAGGRRTGLTSASSACSAVRGSWTARADVGPLGCPEALTVKDAEHAETCGWASMVESGLGQRTPCDLGVLGVLCGGRSLDNKKPDMEPLGYPKALTAEDLASAPGDV